MVSGDIAATAGAVGVGGVAGGVTGAASAAHQMLNGFGNVAVAEVEDTFHLRPFVKREHSS